MKKKIFQILASNILLGIVGIFFAEILFGKWFKNSANPPQRIPISGVRYDRKILPGFSRFIERIPSKNFTTIHFSPETNINCNVLLIGGSTTAQRHLDKSETWSSHYHKHLNEVISNSNCLGGVEVVNAGVSGHSTIANLSDLSYWLKKEHKEADLIVIYQGINDNHFGFNESETSYFIYDLFGTKIGDFLGDIFVFLDQAIIYNSSIYNLVQSISINKKENINNEYKIHKGNRYLILKKDTPQYRYKEVQSINLDKESISKIKSEFSYLRYKRMNNKLYEKALSRGSSLIIITQTFPACKIDTGNFILFSNVKLPEYLPKDYARNLSSNEQLKLMRKGLMNNVFGWCLRAKLNADAQREVFNELRYKYPGKIYLIDYASSKDIHLDEMTLDFYHRDVNATKVLFDDFLKLGLIDSTLEIFDDKY